MKIKFAMMLVIMIIASAVGCASDPLAISCQVRVPDKFQQDPPGWESPTGEPESVRYRKSYEAFWWNCVMVKAEDLEGRCPLTCSGTPAASYGCVDGAMNAENLIRQLLSIHSAKKVKKYLRSIADDPEGWEKIKSYFRNGPRSEKVTE